MINIGLNRIKTISVIKDQPRSSKLISIFLAQLAELGYKVENPEMLNDSVLDNFKEIMESLISMKGGDVDYVPLFNGFPERVPNKEEFQANRVMTFLANVIGMFDESDSNVTVTDDGLCVPNWIFDITEFGASPILGRQSKELFEMGKVSQESRKLDSHTNFITLTVSDDIELDLKTWMINLMYSKSSIKESLKEDLDTLINLFGCSEIDPSRVVFKEVKAYLMKSLWLRSDNSTLSNYISTPTDILRMFASVTDSDISLSNKIKFPKIRRSDRKFILSSLESMENLTEDLNRYKGLWLTLGRYIHPGEYKSKFPKAFKAFDTIRNNKVITYNGLADSYDRDGNLEKLVSLLSKRPGVFARKLHDLLNKFSDHSKILIEFSKISNNVELKNLLILEKYFENTNSMEYRSIINKKGKVIVLPNSKKEKVSNSTIDKLLHILRESIIEKVKADPISFEENTKVWIDPTLRQYTVPLSLRKQSDGLLNISRGTRVKFDNTKVLRIFNYWKENSHRTDLDLSIIEYDKDMKYTGHVSYTNLNEEGITHSGDVTSSQHGACEFIDIDFSKISRTGYIAAQIYVYSGERFNEVEKSYAGWSSRKDSSSSYKTFDISTVDFKFNLTGIGSYAIPFIIDIEKGEIIYIDMYMNGAKQFNNVEGSVKDISIVTQELIKMLDTKPNMLDLIKYRITGSNADIVDNREDADVTYGITGCTYNIDRVDEILSTML